MDDIESFEFALEEAKELIYTGKLSIQDFAILIRRDVSLQIGAGMNLDPGTFWSGLIDDVRIYNRAITP